MVIVFCRYSASLQWDCGTVPAFQHAHVRATAARGLQLLISTTHLGCRECDVMARLQPWWDSIYGRLCSVFRIAVPNLDQHSNQGLERN